MYPGDPHDKHGRRRGWTLALVGVLFLPAQGVWLVAALKHGGLWWVAWGFVLALLIGVVSIAGGLDRRRGRGQFFSHWDGVAVVELLALAVGIVTARVI